MTAPTYIAVFNEVASAREVRAIRPKAPAERLAIELSEDTVARSELST
jgi:hypothetical protein